MWKNYLISLTIFLGFWLVLKFFKNIVISKLKKLAAKTENDFDDLLIAGIDKISLVFYIITAIYLASWWVVLPFGLNRFIYFAFLLVLIFELIRFSKKILNYFLLKFLNNNQTGSKDKQNDKYKSFIKILNILLDIFLWSLGLLLFLSNIGINVSSLITSLGIGGIAIALAVQNILGDIFSSFTILLDQPFSEGDYIILDKEHSGTVIKIGLKTTRLRTLRGDELVVSNKELTSARIKNLKRMKIRRDSFMFGVSYETTEDKLKLIPKLLSDILDNIEKVEFLRCHFFEYGPYSLNFELAYNVLTADYNVFMDVRQEINLQMMKKFKENNIDFAYPTQIIKLTK